MAGFQGGGSQSTIRSKLVREADHVDDLARVFELYFVMAWRILAGGNCAGEKLAGGVVLLAPRGGGMVWRSSPAMVAVTVPVWRFLNSLQQLGQRHSASTAPEGVL